MRQTPTELKSSTVRATTENRLWATPLAGCYRPRARAEGFSQHTLAPKIGSNEFTICLRSSTQDLNQGLFLQIGNHLHPCAEC